MLTLNDMIEFGADTETALKRCAGKEELYLRLVKKIPDSEEFEKLEAAVLEKDYSKAFDIAHGLKGVLLNLSITPIADPVSEMTEFLRNKEDRDYSSYLTEIMTQRDKLKSLCNE